MPSRSPRHLLLVCALVASVALAAVALSGAGSAGADLSSRVQAKEDRAATLRAAVAEESRRIRTTERGLASAQRRLTALREDAERERAELQRIAQRLRRTRSRLTRLQRRLQASFKALESNLNEAYRSPQPDLVSVVVTARGFSDLLERAEFYRRVSNQNARIMADARSTRRVVQKQTDQLMRLQKRQRRVAARLGRKRDRAQTIEAALLQERSGRLAGRAEDSAELKQVNGQLSKLRRRLARAAAAVTPQGGPNAAIRTDAGGQAQAPEGAPAAVRRVIAAGNAIAGLPYSYGGGHGSFKASAYDCSGSISYALAAAGLVSSPMASGPFMSWGEAGEGKWITIYANAGHAFMVVGGWRFDTTALRQGGTRWTRSMRPTGGFTARHPPGL